MVSWAFVGRSRTDSGWAFGLCQITSERSHQPRSWSAKASRQGIPIRSLG